MPARTPQQIFQHHAEALGAENIDGVVADYSDDAFFMTPAGVLRGKAGIRQAFTKLLSDIPQAKWNLKMQLYENDVLLLEWTADRHIRLQGRFHPGPDSALHITEEVSSGF